MRILESLPGDDPNHVRTITAYAALLRKTGRKSKAAKLEEQAQMGKDSESVSSNTH
jgi:hypothetical protein